MSRLFQAPKISSPWPSAVAAIIAGMYPLPSQSQQQAINDFVVGNPEFAVADCWHTFLAGSEKNSEINWPQPGFANLTKSGTPTFLDYTQPNYGWTGNGTNGQLAFGKSPLQMTHFTLNAGSIILDVASTGQDSAFALALLGALGLRFSPRDTSNRSSIQMNSNTTVIVTGITDASGVWAVVRTDAATVLVYRNGTLIATLSEASGALQSAGFAYFSNNSLFSSHHLLGGGIFGPLSAGQVADFTTRWNTFKTSFLA